MPDLYTLFNNYKWLFHTLCARLASSGITEKELMDGIPPLANSRSLIMVAHRFTTVEKCDCIYLLDEGNTVEYGKHEELVSSTLVYRAMYQKTNQ